MAEPAAGLLSPKAMSAFSSAYIRQIVSEVRHPPFSFVLHNCAAKALHLPAILESGARIFHFGAPMDLPAALAQTPNDVLLCGNLDPSAVFVQGTPGLVAELAAKRVAEMGTSRRYIPSSGCDLPARAPLTNLDAFFETIAN